MSNETPLKHSFIYTRVSTGKQAREGLSLANQREKCIEYAKQHGYYVAEVFEEKGVSGKTMNRKEFNRMLTCLRSGDTIIVYALARFGRNVKQMIESYEDIKKRGCQVVSLSESIDDKSSQGKFVLNMMFNIAEYELNETTSRSAAILDNKKKCGEVIGPIAYGFRYNICDGRKYLYPVVEQHRVISFIIDKRNEGYKWADIRRYLNDNGWKPKKGLRWTTSSIVTIYKNNTKVERDKEIYGMFCKGLEIYEKYRVPLIVPRRDINPDNIDPITNEFNYLKYFGYSYGSRQTSVPSLEQMNKDVLEGKMVTSDDIKKDILVEHTISKQEQSERDEDQKEKFKQMTKGITDPVQIKAMADIFFAS